MRNGNIYHINVSYIATDQWKECKWQEGYYALLKTDDLTRLISTVKNMQQKYQRAQCNGTECKGAQCKSAQCKVTIAIYRYIENDDHSIDDNHEVRIIYQADCAPKQTTEFDFTSTVRQRYSESVLFALDCYMDEVDSDSDFNPHSPS